ncbi:hypothetical protein Hanom_Chr15g01358201 [Helianthus anomalus]
MDHDSRLSNLFLSMFSISLFHGAFDGYGMGFSFFFFLNLRGLKQEIPIASWSMLKTNPIRDYNIQSYS